MIKVAVVGYGLSATVFHIPFIMHSDFFTFTAVSSRQKEEISRAHPTVDVYDDGVALITHCDADLIVITAPNEVHYDLAKLALEKGKHVVLEKPMTATSEQALALAALAKQQSLILSVYHNRRWDGDFLTLKRLIETNSLGEIKVFTSQFDRFRPQVRQRWREQPGEATGIWYDLGSHLLDQALFLFGEPQEITARCSMLREGANTVDYFHVMLHYPNKEVILQSSPYAANPNIRFQLQGDLGSYVKYGLDPQEEQLRDGLSPTVPAFGIEPPAKYGVIYKPLSDDSSAHAEKVETLRGSYASYYHQLALAISMGETNPVTALEGAKVIKLIELAQQSSDSGLRINVDLSDFDFR